MHPPALDKGKRGARRIVFAERLGAVLHREFDQARPGFAER
jgi:hypothetical protein